MIRDIMRATTTGRPRSSTGSRADDSDRESDPGICVPTLSWPPDPPSYAESLYMGRFSFLVHPIVMNFLLSPHNRCDICACIIEHVYFFSN